MHLVILFTYTASQLTILFSLFLVQVRLELTGFSSGPYLPGDSKVCMNYFQICPKLTIIVLIDIILSQNSIFFPGLAASETPAFIIFFFAKYT